MRSTGQVGPIVTVPSTPDSLDGCGVGVVVDSGVRTAAEALAVGTEGEAVRVGAAAVAVR
jgi:hypothetical protein